MSTENIQISDKAICAAWVAATTACVDPARGHEYIAPVSPDQRHHCLRAAITAALPHLLADRDHFEDALGMAQPQRATSEFVLMPVEPNEAMETAHAMYGDTSDWWNAVITAVGAVAAPAMESIGKRKLIQLQADGYVVNGVAIYNPETGRRGLVDYLGYVGWQSTDPAPKGPLT